jgi:hypothetical protein
MVCIKHIRYDTDMCTHEYKNTKFYENSCAVVQPLKNIAKTSRKPVTVHLSIQATAARRYAKTENFTTFEILCKAHLCFHSTFSSSTKFRYINNVHSKVYHSFYHFEQF